MMTGEGIRKLAAASTLIAWFLGPAAPADAQTAASPWVSTEQSQVRLISASDGVGQSGTVRLGLQIRLEPGWKAYWRSPGDAGFPPALDWAGSVNMAGAEIRWPAPHRFTLFGLETYGYGDEVVFPIDVALERPVESLNAKAHLSYAICKDVCIPYEADLDLELGRGGGESPFSALIARFAAQVPVRGGPSELALVSVGLEPAETGQSLLVRARADPPFTLPDVLVEGPGGISFGRPSFELSTDGREATFRIPVRAASSAPPLRGAPVVITLLDGARGLESEAVVGANP